MSGFMFGGSALTLDIGVRNATVQPVIAGDVLQVDLLQAIDPTSLESTSDGYDAVHCGVAADSIGHYSITGVVLAPPGKQIGPQEECILRVMGLVDVQAIASTAYVTGRLMTPVAVTPHATTHVRMTMAQGAVPALGSLAMADFSAKAICLFSGTTAAGEPTIKAWFKGLPL